MEHRVGRDEEDVLGLERVALPIEEIGNTLQKYRGLARACDAADEQRRDILMADDLVLFLLDSCRNGRQARGAVLCECCKQHFVLDGDGGVKEGLELVALDVELAA